MSANQNGLRAQIWLSGPCEFDAKCDGWVHQDDGVTDVTKISEDNRQRTTNTEDKTYITVSPFFSPTAPQQIEPIHENSLGLIGAC
jgi:hypothetical protein